MSQITFDPEELESLSAIVATKATASLLHSTFRKMVSQAIEDGVTPILDKRASPTKPREAEPSSPADKSWCYEFTVEGLMNGKDAQAWLKLSSRTLDRCRTMA